MLNYTPCVNIMFTRPLFRTVEETDQNPYRPKPFLMRGRHQRDPNICLNLQSKLLEVFVVLDVRIHRVPDHLGPFFAILGTPFLVFFLDTLHLFLLTAKLISSGIANTPRSVPYTWTASCPKRYVREVRSDRNLHASLAEARHCPWHLREILSISQTPPWLDYDPPQSPNSTFSGHILTLRSYNTPR